jgi:CBS domain-containing protein
MVAKNLGSLPVVERRESGALVGMVSRGDVLRSLRFQLVEGPDVGRRMR